MTTKRFHLGDILTITTGRLVSPDHMGGIYNILNWMTGDDLFTHQLLRASDECKPYLLAQHPDLADVAVPNDFGISGDASAEVATWLAIQIAHYGEYRDVAPVPAEGHTIIDPLTELSMNHPHIPVVIVAVDNPKGN